MTLTVINENMMDTNWKHNTLFEQWIVITNNLKVALWIIDYKWAMPKIYKIYKFGFGSFPNVWSDRVIMLSEEPTELFHEILIHVPGTGSV